jgi:hypothetical protein
MFWTQGLTVAWQELYHLSHYPTKISFKKGIFSDVLHFIYVKQLQGERD